MNSGIASGIALRCNGAEALWYNDTYFSWGHDASYSYFADPVTIGTAGDGYLDFNMHAVNVAMVNVIRELKAENDRLKVLVVHLKPGHFPAYFAKYSSHFSLIRFSFSSIIILISLNSLLTVQIVFGT